MTLMMRLLMKLRKEIDMYTNKELANALTILKKECLSHKNCLFCPLHNKEETNCMLFDIDVLQDNEIKELGERDG